MPQLGIKRRYLNGFLALLALLLGAPTGSYAQEEKPPTPVPIEDSEKPEEPQKPITGNTDDKEAGKGDSESELGEELPEIDWYAVNQSFVEEKNAVVLSGSAWVRFQKFKVQANHIVYFMKTKEVYAEGHVRLRLGESELAAQVAYLDTINEQGYLVDAVVRGTLPSNSSSKTTQGKRNNPGDLPKATDPDEQFSKVVAGQAAGLRRKDPYGVYLDPVDDPQARLRFVFKAEKVILHSRMHMSAENAFVTTDDMAEPIYGIKVANLDLKMREVANPENPSRTIIKPKVITGKGARIKIGPVALFPFPTVTYDMTKHFGFTSFQAGNSKRWGPYALFRIGFGLGGKEDRLFDPHKIYFDIDNRLNVGPAVGSEFEYRTGVRPKDPEARKEFERGQGHIRVYGISEMFITNDDDLDRAVRHRERRVQPKIDGFPRRTYDANDLFLARRLRDDAAPPSFGLDRYEDEERWMIDFGHHQPLRHFLGLNDIELDFKYQRQSDRDFMLDYFPNNYLAANQPEALASAKKSGDNFQAELLYRGNPQEFDGAPPRSPFDFGTFTVYEPALSYQLMPMGFWKGFYVSGGAQAARVRREFEQAIIDQDDLQAHRLHTNVEIERPFRFLGMTFRPHVGGQLTGYDDSRDGGSTLQGAPTYGLDVSSRLYGTFSDLRNDELGIDGFRHIIEPRIEYNAIGETMEDPVDIFDFDEIDDLRGVHRIRLSLEQTFQTRYQLDNGEMKSRNIGGLNLSVDAFPRKKDRQRLLDGDTFDLFKVNGYLRVIDAVTASGELGFSLESGDVETAVYSVTLDPGGRWRLKVFERFNFEDSDRKIEGSDLIGFKLDYQLSERWGLSVEHRSERRRGFLARKGRQLQRIALSRRYGPLVGSVSYSIDDTRNDSSFGFSLAPAFTYRNLVVPSHDLLVSPGEVDEDDASSPNFDPFNIMPKKKKGKKVKPIPVPPPPPPDDKDAGEKKVQEKDASARPAPADTDYRRSEVVLLPETAGKRSSQNSAPQPTKAKPQNLDLDEWSAPATR